jgi:hypothetical protein
VYSHRLFSDAYHRPSCKLLPCVNAAITPSQGSKPNFNLSLIHYKNYIFG